MPHITILSILFITACIVSLVIGILVLQNNYKSPANLCFFALIISICIWSMGLGFATSAPDVAASEGWRRFSAYGWGMAYALILHFVLIITGERRLLKKWWGYFLLYLPAMITLLAFAIPSGMNKTPYQLYRTKFGWVNLAGTNLWDWFFYIYYLGYLITVLVLVLRWGRASEDKNVKEQSQMIFLSLLTALILASISDVLLNSMTANLPQMAPIIMLIPVGAIFRIDQQYGFMSLHKPRPAVIKGSYAGIIFWIIIYTISFFLVSGRAPGVFNALSLDETTARGILIQVQLFISVSLVLKENKPGFISAVILNVIGFLSAGIDVVLNQSSDSFPGIMSYIAVIMIVVLINSYRKKTDANIQEIDRQRKSLEESEQKLSQMAYYDPLTGLPNRVSFVDHLNRSIYAASRNATMIGILFIDLDNFKSVNDTMGHSTGDLLIAQIADRLSTCIRGEDVIARFGGDEFLAKVSNITKMEDLNNITSRITDAFRYPFSIQGTEYFNSVSIGVAMYPVDGEDSETLIRNADIAMYLAKNDGKNRSVFCSPEIKSDVIKKLMLTKNMYRALEKNEMFLFYQPQVNAETQGIIGFEALLRWNDEEYGMVSPDIFIPIAEQTGLIRPIGLWVLRTACEQYKKFKSLYEQDFHISVNLSLEQVKDAGIVEKIRQILIDTETDPRNIQIEITESAALSEDLNVLQRLKGIKNLGISISIDDFGKGYSSFSRLKTFQIDLLKIDMDFVRGISSNSQKDLAIIKSIIQLSENLKIEVLAEGVETEDQFTYLTENGCGLIQGFYFHKPMPASEVELILRGIHSIAGKELGEGCG